MELRRAGPGDAKAVWDALTRAGIKPSSRLVVSKLLATGKYHTVDHNTIWRWHNNGWKRKGTDGPLNPVEQTKRDVEGTLTVLTGDPTTTLGDLMADPKVQAEKVVLEGMTDDTLLKLASRESLYTSIILMRRVQEKASQVGTDDAKGLAMLQKALSGSLSAGADGFAKLMEMHDKLLKVLNNTDAAPVAAHEEDPLSDALDEFASARIVHS